MPQLAAPAFDVRTGSWTPAPLWEAIDDNTELIAADDADFIESAANPHDDACEIGLSAVLAPGCGRRVLRYRFGKDRPDGQRIDLTVRLLEGANVLDVWGHPDISDGIVQAAQTVIASIGDYGTLRVRFDANAPDATGEARKARVSWVELEVPTAAGVAAFPPRHAYRPALAQRDPSGRVRLEPSPP
jgi:hypothetical protein